MGLSASRRLERRSRGANVSLGSGNLLLGLLREGEGIAVGILEDLGVDLGELRAAVLQELARGEVARAES